MDPSPRWSREGAEARAWRALVVEDDSQVRTTVARYLRHHGFEVSEAGSCAEARFALERRASGQAPPDVLLVDHRLPDGDSLAVLSIVRELAPETPVVVLTGHGTVDLAVRALKLGAVDVLTKPVPMALLLERLGDAVEEGQRGPAWRDDVSSSGTRPVAFVRPAESARRLAKTAPALADGLLGESPAILALAAQIRAVRDADCPVLILGETGSGKGVVARMLHEASARSSRPFVDVNCATLTRELVESELFGHARGAFTGAQASKVGLFEAANGGTLFLDEIGDIDAAVQPKLLKAIEERRFRRMGEVHDRASDVRLLAARHKDLLGGGGFRGDLFYRISTISLEVPPLRARGGDVVLLARAFLARACDRYRRPTPALAACAERALVAHDWPGNVRELRNVIDRAAVMTRGTTITADELRFDQAAPPRTSSGAQTLDDVERRHVEAALLDAGWDVARAARALGIARSTLYVKIKTYGLKAAVGSR